MSLNDYATVTMPERKITINSSNKNRTWYVYYTKRAYRNSKNQPTSEKILIGKRDPESGMLIPNKNYFDIFGQDMILHTKSILDFGNFFAINSVLEELGVSDILKKIMKKSSLLLHVCSVKAMSLFFVMIGAVRHLRIWITLLHHSLPAVSLKT